MAVTVKLLVATNLSDTTQTTQYTSTNLTTIIDKFTATNYSATAASVSVNLVAYSATAGNTNLIVKSKTLQPSETYTFPELVGQVLPPNAFISTLAGTANAINIRVSGREIS